MLKIPAHRLNTALIFILLLANISFAQNPVAVSTDEILRRAGDQRKVYVEEFKNLLSQESKTFEIFGNKGEVRKRRVVTSIFIVYQLSKDNDQIAEYRNVIAVDGKTQDKTDKRAQEFFEKIAAAESSKKELERLQDESSRFDEELIISGLTLFQGVPLAEHLRPFFEFKLVGKQMIADSEVYAVSYKQIRESPYIITGTINEPADGKLSLKYDADLGEAGNLNGRLSGKFLIDSNTFQIWHEQRVMTLQPKGFDNPVLLAENIFEYQKSDFAILTPKKISHIQYSIKKKERSAVKEAGVIFEYGKFTKPDVEVKSADVK